MLGVLAFPLGCSRTSLLGASADARHDGHALRLDVAGAGPSDGAPYASADRASEPSPDEKVDSARDLPGDLAPDLAPDLTAARDSLPDLAPDQSRDGSQDLAPDRPQDLAIDLSQDLTTATAPDSEADTGTDTGLSICGGDWEYWGYPPSVCGGRSFCAFENRRCGHGPSSTFCQAMPAQCPVDVTPVCGCDGKAYDNACLAEMAGVDLSQDGGCPPPPGTFACGELFCADRQYCDIMLQDEIGFPASASCNPLPAGCGDPPDCACLGLSLFCFQMDAHLYVEWGI
jgi:hypothetical protein